MWLVYKMRWLWNYDDYRAENNCSQWSSSWTIKLFHLLCYCVCLLRAIAKLALEASRANHKWNVLFRQLSSQSFFLILAWLPPLVVTQLTTEAFNHKTKEEAESLAFQVSRRFIIGKTLPETRNRDLKWHLLRFTNNFLIKTCGTFLLAARNCTLVFFSISIQKGNIL